MRLIWPDLTCNKSFTSMCPTTGILYVPGKHILRIRCAMCMDRQCELSTLNEIPYKQ